MLRYIKWVSIGVVLVIIVVFACFSFLKGEGLADVGTLLILGFTLIALIFYASYTYEISEVNKRTYEESKLPVVSLTISPEPNISQNYDTRVVLQNLSSYNLQAFVKLNLKVKGQPVELGGAYSGKEPWLLTARQLINGHFYITEVLAKVGTDVETMRAAMTNALFYSPQNVDQLRKNQLSMCIEVYYRGETREVSPPNIWPHESRNPRYKDSFTRILGNPPQKWYFDFSRNVWVYDL